MSETSRTQVRYGDEGANWGTIPSLAFTNLRFTGESLGLPSSGTTSSEIRSDRQITDFIRQSLRAEGDVNFELSYSTFDDILESVMFSTWLAAQSVGPATDIDFANADNSINTAGAVDFSVFSVGQWIEVRGSTSNDGYHQISKTTAPTSTKIVVEASSTITTEAAGDSVTIKNDGTLRNGVARKSFTLEKEFSDITQFLVFTGMVANTLNLTVAAEGILTGSFGFMGKDMARQGSSASTGGPNAAPTTQVMNAGDHVGQILEGETALGANIFVTQTTLAITNNVRSRRAVGNIFGVDSKSGRFNPTGTFQIYFEDGSLVDKYIADTESALSYKTEDAAGNAYMITVPRLKFSDARTVIGGPDTDVIVEMTFQGIRQADIDAMLQIDRFAA